MVLKHTMLVVVTWKTGLGLIVLLEYCIQLMISFRGI
jgi:hypothetical protein